MLSDRFERALRKLKFRAAAYEAEARSPRKANLSARRGELDHARSQMAEIRRDEHGPMIDPPTPDWVDPDLGRGRSSPLGWLAGVLAGAILLGGMWAIVSAGRNFGAPDFVVLTDTVAEQLVTTDQGCQWVISLAVRNTLDTELRVTSMTVDGPGRVIEEPNPLVVKGNARRTISTARLLSGEACPPELDALVHGDLRIDYRRLGSDGSVLVNGPERLIFSF